jgi:hypothetical protein
VSSRRAIELALHGVALLGGSLARCLPLPADQVWHISSSLLTLGELDRRRRELVRR